MSASLTALPQDCIVVSAETIWKGFEQFYGKT